MKTDDLIAALAADATPRPGPGTRLNQCLSLSLLVSLVALIALWHLRPDLADALASPVVLKTLLPAVLAVAALWLARGLSRPDAQARAQLALIAVLIGGVVIAFTVNLVNAGFDGLIAALDNQYLLVCFVSVPALAAVPLAASMWAMKSGAPANARLAGGAAGLLSGAVGAAVFSLHCPVDSLLFLLPAYGAAILVVVGFGAFLGPRVLRW